MQILTLMSQVSDAVHTFLSIDIKGGEGGGSSDSVPLARLDHFPLCF